MLVLIYFFHHIIQFNLYHQSPNGIKIEQKLVDDEDLGGREVGNTVTLGRCRIEFSNHFVR